MESHQRKTLNYIENIQGVGIVRARQYYEKLTALKLLNPAVDYSEAVTRKLIYTHRKKISLPVDAVYDLKYNPERIIPRAIITDFSKLFAKLLGSDGFFIGGSYSREQPTSGDIDLMVIGSRELLDQVFVEPLVQQKIMLPLITLGDNRATTYLKKGGRHYRLDIFLTLPEHIVFMRTYLVGSGRFNLFMRAAAKRRGLVLNQYGLYSKGKNSGGETLLEPVKVANEEELFRELGMKWVPYAERNI